MPAIHQEGSDPLRTTGTDVASVRPRLRLFLATATALLILAGGGAVSYYWLTHRAKARPRPPEPRAALVEVVGVHPRTDQVLVSAMGVVVPAKSIELASRVSGKVVSLTPEFIPGGMFKAGDIMLQIDRRDYDLAVRQQRAELQKRLAEFEQRTAEVKQREAEVITAQCNLALEMGEQAVARREYELLGETIRPEDEALVLRRPQLKAREAACAAARTAKRSAEAVRQAAVASRSAAETALEKAELDLERTTIRAPFDAVIQSRSVNLGSQVSPGQPLASLVGTQEFWVKVSLPVDDLKWIHIPGFNAEKGSNVRVYYEAAWGREAFRLCTVKRLMSDLEPQGRMAMLLVSVRDPLDTKAALGRRHPLLLGSYVRVEIEGLSLPNVIRVSRTALRDGKNVWIMKPDHTLEIRPVRVKWSGKEDVLISEGLRDGELLITSDLAAPVGGMRLRTSKAAAGSCDDRRMTGPGTTRPAEERP